MNNTIAQLSRIENANRLIQEDGTNKKIEMNRLNQLKKEEINADMEKRIKKELKEYSEQLKNDFFRMHSELDIDADQETKKLRNSFNQHKNDMINTILKNIIGA